MRHYLGITLYSHIYGTWNRFECEHVVNVLYYVVGGEQLTTMPTAEPDYATTHPIRLPTLSYGPIVHQPPHLYTSFHLTPQATPLYTPIPSIHPPPLSYAHPSTGTHAPQTISGHMYHPFTSTQFNPPQGVPTHPPHSPDHAHVLGAPPILPPYTPTPPMHPIDRYASYLRAYYRSKKLPTYSKWPPTASKKYIHLAVVKKEHVNKQQADEFTKLTIHGNIDDIIRRKEELKFSGVGLKEDGSLAQLMLVEGAPGIGKTTFAWKFCRKWSKGQILQQYRLVVLLRLRDKRVREARSVFDLFYHSNPTLREAVATEIEANNGRSVLLLFEGYDELSRKLQTEESIFLDILYRECLPEVAVLITSRPSATEILHVKFKAEISQHIEILGFTSGDTASFIDSMIKDPQLRKDFSQYLKCYPHIRGLMYVPLNAVIVTEIYKTTKQDDKSSDFVPTTMTELYTTVTRTVLLRYLKNHKEYGQQEWQWKLKSFADLPEELHKQFNTICQVAFEGIVKDEFIFDGLLEDFNTLDLMQSASELYVDHGAVSYNFFHLTLQEYLAARHMSLQPTEVQIQYFIQQTKQQHAAVKQSLLSYLHPPYMPLNVPVDSSHFQNALRFSAGLTKFESIPTSTLEFILLEDHDEDLDNEKRISLNSLHWLFEAQCITTFRETIKETTSHLGFNNDFESLTPFDCFVVGFAVSHINCEWKINLWTSAIGDDGLEMLAAGMNYSEATFPPSVRSVNLILSNCDISSAGLNHLMEMPEHVAESITDLDLGYNGDIRGGVVSLLSKVKSLKELNLSDTNLSPKEVELLANLLSHSVLEHLYLDKSLPADSLSGLIFKGLCHNNTVRFLSMSSTQVSMENVSLLISALRANTVLRELYLSSSNINEDTACEIAGALCDNSALEILDLAHNPIGQRGATALSEMLRRNRTLQQLGVYDCSIGENGALYLSQSLKHNTTLKNLCLDEGYKSSFPHELHTRISNTLGHMGY